MAEVQFSDCRGPKSKFLPFLFSVAKANITYYREEKNGIPSELGAWPVEGTSWYLGSEPRRGAPYNLNITFILKNEEVGCWEISLPPSIILLRCGARSSRCLAV
jgi:hypothetical protein